VFRARQPPKLPVWPGANPMKNLLVKYEKFFTS